MKYTHLSRKLSYLFYNIFKNVLNGFYKNNKIQIYEINYY